MVTLVYWPTLANGFIWDDDANVEHNPALTSPSGLLDIWFKLGAVPQYYPLVQSTFWAEYHLWRLDPRGYHIVNFLLHATAAVLVWRLLLRLAVPGAWLAAAIFAVHPVCVESVAWVTERKNVLSCTLAIGSLLAYLRFSPPEAPGSPEAHASTARGPWRYYALAFALYVAALLAKTATASVPAVLLVIYWWKRGRVTWRDAVRIAPFFAVGLALSAVTVWVEKTHVGATGNEWNLSAVDRVLIAGRALWFYAGKLLWPHPLIFVYPRWVVDARLGWQYLFPAAAVSAIVALWLARSRIGRGPLAAVLIFAGVLLPALGFFNIYMFRYSFVADHLQYHASIGLISLATATLVLAANRLGKHSRWVVPLAAAAVLLPLGVVARHKTHAYKSPQSNYEGIIALNPECWAAHFNLGVFLNRHGKCHEAILHFRKAIELKEKQARESPTVNSHRTDIAEIHAQLAGAQHKAGRPADAEGSLRKSLEIREKVARDNPTIGEYQNDIAECYLGIGVVQLEMGRAAEAESSFQKELEIRETLVRDHPTSSVFRDGLAWCYLGLASAHQRANRPAEAEASYRKSIEIRQKLAGDNPTISDYQNNLAAIYVDLGLLQREMGRVAEAESAFRKAIEIREKLEQLALRADPKLFEAYRGLARICLMQGRPADAAATWKELLRVAPNDAQAHAELALDYLLQKNFTQASLHYREALRLEPRISLDDHSYLWANNLAWILATNPDPRLRNGTEAVHWAKQACEADGYKQPDLMNTLAAAYAESGNFDEAIKLSEKLIQLPGAQAKLVELVTGRLKLYKASKPFRE